MCQKYPIMAIAGVLPNFRPQDILGRPQPVEAYDEEETVYGRTNYPDFAWMTETTTIEETARQQGVLSSLSIGGSGNLATCRWWMWVVGGGNESGSFSAARICGFLGDLQMIESKLRHQTFRLSFCRCADITGVHEQSQNDSPFLAPKKKRHSIPLFA